MDSAVTDKSSEIPADARVNTTDELRAVLDRVRFENSVMNFGWRFEVQPVTVRYEGTATFFDATQNRSVTADSPERRGWLLWASFQRPDTVTGEVSRGRGRDEVVWEGWTESAVVKTAWVVVNMLVTHELMEGIQYDGHRFFDPHNSVHELNYLQRRKGR